MKTPFPDILGDVRIPHVGRQEKWACLDEVQTLTPEELTHLVTVL